MQERRAVVAALTATHSRRLALTAVVAAAVVAADQATKSWAVADLHRPVHLVGPFGLALQYNSGTAFSVLSGSGAWLTPLVVLVLAVVVWLAWRARSRLAAVAFGLLVGGAVGNLADRLVRGHHGDVVDFVTLSHWPTFNVADACITVGVVLLAAGYLTRPRQAAGTRRDEEADGATACGPPTPAQPRGVAEDAGRTGRR